MGGASTSTTQQQHDWNTNQQGNKKKRKGEDRKRDDGLKMPANAFFMFCDDHRRPNNEGTEGAARMGQMWSDLGPEGQLPYRRRYATAKARIDKLREAQGHK